MNVEDAIYDDVHGYPGGTASLAPRLGVTVQTLRNMAKPDDVTHGWSLNKFRKLLSVSITKKSLQALCEENGGTFMPLGAMPGEDGVKLLRALNKMASEFSDVPRAIERAIKGDGRISANEMRTIERECNELIQAVLAAQGMARTVHERHGIVPEEDRPA